MYAGLPQNTFSSKDQYQGGNRTFPPGSFRHCQYLQGGQVPAREKRHIMGQYMHGENGATGGSPSGQKSHPLYCRSWCL